ncbi:hypothetical protein L6164_000089 [Bauhinia variegata]|uniref:Uncharacterized protein n=1 Tax=Bauhinia variegata TaxID=167791 RepID=A0ACB9Q5E1_BAUVA|nr:hypothetical protein L6164_000089 [Bauhinia variegata]
MEEDDADDSATALKEAMEEIGLETCLNYLMVIPVVDLLTRRDFEPVLNIDEVDALFDILLEMFLQVDVR